MSVINDVLIAVIGMALDTNPYAAITIGALPADNGISAAIAVGAPDSTFLTKGMAYQFTMVLNGKHTSQQVVSDTLNDIHQALTQTMTYPRGDTFQITNIDTITTPEYLNREENKQYLYGSSLRVKFFYFAQGAD